MKLQETLIGAQIISVNEQGFAIKTPNGNIRTFVVTEDYGDCCGYNNWNLKIFEENISRNPIITKVEWVEGDDAAEADTATITLFGEYAPLVCLDSESSSGSGWCYGACVTLQCVETAQNFLITSY